MSDVLSPDKSLKLSVVTQTENTESGPLTYSQTDYWLTVTEIATGKEIVKRQEMSYWDDSASRGRGGLTKWTLGNRELVLEYVDGKIEKVALR